MLSCSRLEGWDSLPMQQWRSETQRFSGLVQPKSQPVRVAACAALRSAAWAAPRSRGSRPIIPRAGLHLRSTSEREPPWNQQDSTHDDGTLQRKTRWTLTGREELHGPTPLPTATLHPVHSGPLTLREVTSRCPLNPRLVTAAVQRPVQPGLFRFEQEKKADASPTTTVPEVAAAPD